MMNSENSDNECVVISTVPKTNLLDKTIDISEDRSDSDIGYFIDTRPDSSGNSASKEIRNPFYKGSDKGSPIKKKNKKRKRKKQDKLYTVALNVAKENNLEAATSCKRKKKKDYRNSDNESTLTNVKKLEKDKNNQEISPILPRSPKRKRMKHSKGNRENSRKSTSVSVGTNTDTFYFNISQLYKGNISDPEISNGSNGLLISRATSPEPATINASQFTSTKTSCNVSNTHEPVSPEASTKNIFQFKNKSDIPTKGKLPQEVLNVSNGLVLNELRKSVPNNFVERLQSHIPKTIDLKGKGRKRLVSIFPTTKAKVTVNENENISENKSMQATRSVDCSSFNVGHFPQMMGTSKSANYLAKSSVKTTTKGKDIIKSDRTNNGQNYMEAGNVQQVSSTSRGEFNKQSVAVRKRIETISNSINNVSTWLQRNETLQKSKKCTPPSRKTFSVDEEKLLIKTVFRIKPDLNISQIDEKIFKEIYTLIKPKIDRSLSSITAHWFSIIQPTILSHMYGKLEYPSTAAIFHHLICHKVESINDIDWKNLICIWPYHNEKSLKAIIGRANIDSRVPPENVKLYTKLNYLLPFYNNKKITPEKLTKCYEIINCYEAIRKKKRQAEYDEI